MAAVRPKVTTVRAWDGKPEISDGPFAESGAPRRGLMVNVSPQSSQGLG